MIRDYAPGNGGGSRLGSKVSAGITFILPGPKAGTNAVSNLPGLALLSFKYTN